MTPSWRVNLARSLARYGALALALALFFTLIGPFGSYSEPIGRRLVECLAYSTALVIWGPIYPRLRAWLLDHRAPRSVAAIAAASIMTVPIDGYVWLLARAISPGSSVTLAKLALGVASVAIPIALAGEALRWSVERDRPASAMLADTPPRLLARLPAALGGDVLALQAEDHYVRVHTGRGSALLLMRFADALAELDGAPGLRVHRSWWVAREAVAGAAPTGRRANLRLVNGLAVPVSRAAMPRARALGLLGVRG